ncbi:MBL fold metallo-hydrolase [Methanoculleus chikugoensis]|uniref:MBL fold metallo-hydrolase n=1 Tax=Methanoculleus chikugoensis TaxID=118126 RepID=UPI000AAFCB03|nr:MBL fold metallo-hydrolase [Methanoculleus chikugoensis]
MDSFAAEAAPPGGRHFRRYMPEALEMKLAVLVDNATLTDRYFLAEPGLSIHIEDGGTRFLFDAGYSGIFVANAQKMGIDLLRVDDVVISHGHLDHTWGGLDALLRLHTEAIFEGRERVEPAFIAHPDAFLTRSCNGVGGEIGCHLSVEELFRHGNVLLTPASLWLTENLVFLGEIERRFEFERAPPHAATSTPPRRHPGRHRPRRHRARLQDRGGACHRNRLLSLGGSARLSSRRARSATRTGSPTSSAGSISSMRHRSR